LNWEGKIRGKEGTC